ESLLQGLNSRDRAIRQSAVEQTRALSAEELLALVLADRDFVQDRVKQAKRKLAFSFAICWPLVILNLLYLDLVPFWSRYEFFEMTAVLFFLMTAVLFFLTPYYFIWRYLTANRRTSARLHIAQV